MRKFKTKKEFIKRFEEVHSEKITNYIKSIEDDFIPKDEFIKTYKNLTTCKRPSKGSKRTYEYLQFHNWIKSE